MQEKINEFYQRLKTQSIQILQFGLPVELKELITCDSLKTAYFYLQVPEVKAFIENELLTDYSSLRLDKADTNLGRTLNLIIDPLTRDIQLILETKSKVVDQEGITKKIAISVPSGTSKSIKAAWRIDTPTPIKMANAVFYAHDEHFVDDDLKEEYNHALIEKDIVDKIGLVATQFFNVNAIGAEHRKEGIRRHTSSSIPQPYFAKQSYYSTYALDDLETALENTNLYRFTLDIRHNMTENLLKAIEYLQELNIVHQDLKTKNILLYSLPNGGYTLKIIDFGIAYHSEFTPEAQLAATLGYESPEISAYYSKKATHPYYHDYFHDMNYKSYGRDVYKKNSKSKIFSNKTQLAAYKECHNKNDMWSLGVILHEIYKKDKPSLKKSFKDMPLLVGLLEPNRQKRFTIQQALASFNKTTTAPKKNVYNALTEKNNNFTPVFAQKNNITNVQVTEKKQSTILKIKCKTGK